MTGKKLEEITENIVNLEYPETVKDQVNEAISQGVEAYKIVESALREGLARVGKKYEKGEYFLSELMYAGSLAEEIFDVLSPHLEDEESKEIGTIILGTVRNDIHDIGKSIFSILAEAEGFRVIDLGVDVEPETFLEYAEKYNPDIVAMSCLLTTTLEEIGPVVDILKENGIREKLKVILGGNAVNEEAAEKYGADAAATNAVNGLEMCKNWMGTK